MLHMLLKNVDFYTQNKNFDSIESGEIGFITAGIKHVSDYKVGDTITDYQNRYKNLYLVSNLVDLLFCGLYPVK